MSAKGFLCVIDNQDSFLYSLVDECQQLGFQTQVYRNDVALNHLQKLLAQQAQQGPVVVVVSSGPNQIQQAEQLRPLLAHCIGRYPVFGIGLGCHALIEYFGGQVTSCLFSGHGKTLSLTLHPHPLLASFQTQEALTVARYHTFSIHQLPADFHVVASYENIPFAVCHRNAPLVGLAFQPESILTPQGSLILQDCLRYLLHGHAQNGNSLFDKKAQQPTGGQPHA